MPYKLIPNPARLSSDDSIISLCAILMAFLFFKFILPSIERRYKRRLEKMSNVRNLLGLSDKYKLDKSICSKQCCFLGNYPNDIIPKGSLTKEQLKNYVPTGYSCRNGCHCVTKDQADIIGNRGEVSH